MRISDWSSDVCSSDLALADQHQLGVVVVEVEGRVFLEFRPRDAARALGHAQLALVVLAHVDQHRTLGLPQVCFVGSDLGSRHKAIIAEKTGGVGGQPCSIAGFDRSEEHTSELQSLMRISYAVFCLKKK